MTKQSTQFVPATAAQQKLFITLVKNPNLTALLVRNEVTTKGFTDYYFVYEDPGADDFALATFYAQVTDSDKRLQESATARLTKKMIHQYIKPEPLLLGSVMKGVDELSTEVTGIYDDTSQANYYFDCKGVSTVDEKTQNISNIEKIKKKGSFCCILKKGTEYFILTAGHNLENDKSSNYRLIKNDSNYVDLELRKDYMKDYDVAILRINRINEKGKIIYDITNNKSDNKDIKKSIDFYQNAIKPKFSTSKPLKDGQQYGKGYLIGIPIESDISKVQKLTKINYNEGSDDFSLDLVIDNYQGMSGGLVITNLELLIGNFRGTNNDYKATNFDIPSDYNLV